MKSGEVDVKVKMNGDWRNRGGRGAEKNRGFWSMGFFLITMVFNLKRTQKWNPLNYDKNPLPNFWPFGKMGHIFVSLATNCKNGKIVLLFYKNNTWEVH